jgi:phosphonate transport system ATP-binding protein
MSVFRFRGATLGYEGRTVLSDLNFGIDPGERVALVGPSGAGKSTLLAALYDQRREGTALVPQDGALVKPLSVYHNVFIGRLHSHTSVYNLVNLLRPFRERVREVSAILDQLELGEKLFTPVGELSGGQQQRTAVARALYHGGDVLLGDEPVSSVDGVQAQEVLGAINRAYPTVVLVMHDVELALQFTTRIVGIRDGGIVIDRPSQGLSPSDLDMLYR